MENETDEKYLSDKELADRVRDYLLNHDRDLNEIDPSIVRQLHTWLLRPEVGFDDLQTQEDVERVAVMLYDKFADNAKQWSTKQVTIDEDDIDDVVAEIRKNKSLPVRWDYEKKTFVVKLAS